MYFYINLYTHHPARIFATQVMGADLLGAEGRPVDIDAVEAYKIMLPGS